ncbi:MAG: hypothetical protein EXR58_03755 [Chloroflexi bacterium]|nr:hypothetical protein [Chloroflexota bacterium]
MQAGARWATRRPLQLALFVAALSLLGAWPAFAQEAGPPLVVAGQVINGTAGASAPEGLRVQVVAFDQNRALGSWESTTEPDGTFQVQGVQRNPGATYVVGADYGGASYLNQLDPGEGAAAAAALLVVYESVALDPGVRMERSALIVTDLNPEQQTLTLLEVHSLVNASDRTFLPRADGAGGPSGLLVFGLPSHAFSLSPQLGLDSDQIVQIDRGFASLAPVRPGGTQIAFSYQFPFAETDYAFQRTVRYPTDSLNVFAPATGPTIGADGFPPADATVVGGREYQQLQMGALSSGTVVRLKFGKLPARVGFNLPVAPAPIGAVGASLGALAVVTAWWLGRRAGAVAPSNDQILDSLVALDLEHEAGRIPEAEYLAARNDLLAQTPTE